MSTKGYSGFFLFCLDLELFAKIKRPGCYTLVFYIFINNSTSKQNLKNPEHSFVDIVKYETGAEFLQKNIKLSGSWSFSEFSIFQTNSLVSRK